MKFSGEVALDHIAIPATNPSASATFLADILGLKVFTDGPPDDLFYCVGFSSSQIMFALTKAPFDPVHMAFRVSATKFAEAVNRIRTLGVAFGNSPEAPNNGRTSDEHGQYDLRVYFPIPDGHLFELCAYSQIE